MSDKNNVHEGHRQRMRNRYLAEGLCAFSDHEVLEFLLYFSIPRQNTNETAHLLIKEYNGIFNLMNAEPEDIIKRCRVSERTAILISLIPKLSGWYITKQNAAQERDTLDSSGKVGRYAIGLLTGARNETFYCICLSVKHKVLSADAISEGTVTQTYVSPRAVVELAIKYNAAVVVIAHNHPSADLTPSKSDIDITATIKDALSYLNIRLADHIIVGGGKYFSFAEQGLIG